VPMRWRLEPRFDYGRAATRVEARRPFPVAFSRGDALGVCAWDAGACRCDASAVSGDFEAHEGGRALLTVAAAHGEPLVFPARDEVEAREAARTEAVRQAEDLAARQREVLAQRNEAEAARALAEQNALLRDAAAQAVAEEAMQLRTELAATQARWIRVVMPARSPR